MRKRIPLSLCIGIAVLCIAVTFTVTMLFSGNIYNSVISNLSLRSSSASAIDEISAIISNYYYGSESGGKNDTASFVAAGYIDALDDENCRYLTADEYKEYSARLESKTTGTGIETCYDNDARKLLVACVYEGSPAEASGIKSGDVILSIGGEDVTSLNYTDLLAKLPVNQLESVEITCSRDGEEYTAEPMGGFTLPGVASYISAKTGVIRINAFCKNTANELSQAVASLSEKGASSYIFDLRGTSEGTTEYAMQALDVLVPALTDNACLASTFDKDGKRIAVFSADSSSVNADFICLVNHETSGAAELFACDLRDISGAELVGNATKGVCTSQKAFPLKNGDAAVLTNARVEPYNKDSAFDKTGLKPDHPCDLAAAAPDLRLLTPENDTQLTLALKLLDK